jgi:hypothetical protein
MELNVVRMVSFVERSKLLVNILFGSSYGVNLRTLDCRVPCSTYNNEFAFNKADTVNID